MDRAPPSEDDEEDLEDTELGNSEAEESEEEDDAEGKGKKRGATFESDASDSDGPSDHDVSASSSYAVIKHTRCSLCMDESSDVDWFKWVQLGTAKDTWERQPLEDLCRKCGIAIESFPLYECARALELARTDRGMKAEIMIIGEILDGKRHKDWRAVVVQVTHHVGLETSRDIALVKVAEFQRVLGTPPLSLKTTAVNGQIVDPQCEESMGVVMSLKDLPTEEDEVDLEWTRGRLYDKNETNMQEFILQDTNHWRKSQGLEQFAVTAGQTASDRGEAVKRTAWTWAEWKAKVDEHQAKLKFIKKEEKVDVSGASLAGPSFSASSAQHQPTMRVSLNLARLASTPAEAASTSRGGSGPAAGLPQVKRAKHGAAKRASGQMMWPRHP